MACDGEFKVFPNCQIESLQFQVFSKGYCTDDVLVRFVDGGNGEKKLLGQIKRTIRFNRSCRDFTDSVQAAWLDFQNEKLFRKGNDALALITGPLCAKDICTLDWLFNQARNLSMAAFFEKMRFGRDVSKTHRNEFELICEILGVQNDGPVDDEQLYAFLRSFYVFQSDMWYEEGVVSSFADSLLKRHFLHATPRTIFNEIVAQVSSRNSAGGDISRSELVEAIQKSCDAVLRPEPEETKEKEAARIAQIKTALPLMEERANLQNHHLALLALIGTWREDKQEDRQLVCEILQVNEARLESYQQELIERKQPMMIAEGGLVRVLRRRSIWKATAGKVSSTMVERFLGVAKEQLSEIDCRLDVDPDKRLFSDVKSGFSISESLRRGLSEGLALLGVESDRCNRAPLSDRSGWASSVVRECLQESSWKTWATLDELLPFLAEAAPHEYLACVERFLRKKKDGMESLFAQERSGMMGRTYLWGFLEALQRLAWLPEFFATVLDILARLAKLDPGGQWGPRPVAVMQRILHPYGAHTTVGASMRLDVFSALLKKYPEQLWDVLVSLLPSGGYSFVEDANEPVYRRPPNMKKVGEDIPLAEAFDQFDRYETLAVGLCGTDSDRMTRLIDSAVEEWRNEPFQTLADYLERNIGKLSAEQRYSVWEKLRDKYRYLHVQAAKTGENQEWFKKRDDSVAALIRLYEPSDPQYRYLPLFNLAAEYEEQDSSGRSQEEVAADIERRRRDAVEEIWKTAGTEALLAFACRSEMSQLIGKFFGEIASADVDSELLPGKLRFDITDDYWPIAGYVAGRFAKERWSWVDGLVLDDWTVEQRAMLLVLLPFNEHTWNRLHSFLGDDESLYWRHVDVRGRMHGNDVEAAVSGLLKYGCFYTAADALSFSSLGEKLPRADLSRRILASFVEARAKDKPSSLSSYHIEKMIQAVQQSPDVDAKETARYEWHFFGLFESGAHRGFSPVALNNELANNPKLFCEALGLAYLTSKEAKVPQGKRKKKPRSEMESRRAENAWRLLHDWNTVPGASSGAFDEKAFRKWAKETFALAKKIDRLEAAKMVLGGVAIHAPECSDFWMPHAFAQLMEKPGNEQMLTAFQSAKFNSRGVYNVDPTMQADQKLADQYEQQAQQADRFGYLGLARAMRNLAKSTMDIARLDKEEHDMAEIERRILREEKAASKSEDN